MTDNENASPEPTPADDGRCCVVVSPRALETVFARVNGSNRLDGTPIMVITVTSSEDGRVAQFGLTEEIADLLRGHIQAFKRYAKKLG